MSAFSNGFEWDCWSENWCYRCTKEETCPLLDQLFCEDKTPECWTEGTDDLRDRYHCPEFEEMKQ